MRRATRPITVYSGSVITSYSIHYTKLYDEYSVIGRVARRIWSVAMRDLYGGDQRSQKLKYHIQTSGRSLHAQDIEFNDIRTTRNNFV